MGSNSSHNHLFIDETGKRYGRLTVLRWDDTHPGSSASKWTCLCDCGTVTYAAGTSLRTGNTRSCGCLRRETARTRNRIHGMTTTRVYQVWKRMLSRCTNSNLKDYVNYGGRGIKVCERWRGSFENFCADMGEPPSDKHSIDRIDNNGNYEPDNCRWATQIEQRNNTRANRFITYRGETRTLAEWARHSGITQPTLKKRLNSGLPLDEVFDPKPRPRGMYARTKLLGLNAPTQTQNSHSFESMDETALREEAARLGIPVPAALEPESPQ